MAKVQKMKHEKGHNMSTGIDYDQESYKGVAGVEGTFNKAHRQSYISQGRKIKKNTRTFNSYIVRG